MGDERVHPILKSILAGPRHWQSFKTNALESTSNAIRRQTARVSISRRYCTRKRSPPMSRDVS